MLIFFPLKAGPNVNQREMLRGESSGKMGVHSPPFHNKGDSVKDAVLVISINIIRFTC